MTEVVEGHQAVEACALLRLGRKGRPESGGACDVTTPRDVMVALSPAPVVARTDTQCV